MREREYNYKTGIDMLSLELLDCAHTLGEIIVFDMTAAISGAIISFVWLAIGRLLPEGIVQDILTKYVPAFYAISTALLCCVFNVRLMYLRFLSKNKKESKSKRGVAMYDLSRIQREGEQRMEREVAACNSNIELYDLARKGKIDRL